MKIKIREHCFVSIIPVEKKYYLPKLHLTFSGKTAMLMPVKDIECTQDEMTLIGTLFGTKDALTNTFSGYVDQCMFAFSDEMEEKEAYLIRTESQDPLSKDLLFTESWAMLSTSKAEILESLRKITGSELEVVEDDVHCEAGLLPDRHNENHAITTFFIDSTVRGNRVKLMDLKSLETLSNVVHVMQMKLRSETEECISVSLKELIKENFCQ